MASTGGGKIRSKRSKVSSKPYARRTSFLGRVTETVRDFITPSWLSNAWHGIPEEESGNPSDGGTQQGGIVTSNVLHGFPTRVDPEPDQFENPEEASQDDGDDRDGPDIIMEDQAPDVILEEQPSTSVGQRGRKTPFSRYARPLGASTPNDDIQIIAEKRPSDKDDAASDTSVSTSGCSSLVPHLDKADHREKLSKFNLDRLSAEMARNRSDSPRFRSDSPRLHSDSPRNTSLWSETSISGRSGGLSRPARPQQAAQSSRRPAFNSSYFCTPRGSSSSFGNTTVTDSPGRSSPFSSPFYPGKTTFGGSSAQRPAKRPAKRPRTSPYEVHLPVKRHVRIRPSNRNDVDVTSQTAKRILETLEKMSTPLSDAKKIPLSPTSSPFSFTPSRSSRLRQPSSSQSHAPGVHERGVRIPGPPTSGLRIPQVASIAENRQPPLSMPKSEPKREAKPQTVSRPPMDHIRSAPSHESVRQASACPAVDNHASNRKAINQSTNDKDDQIHDKTRQLKEIKDLNQSAIKLGQRVDCFIGITGDKEYLSLQELLTRNLLKLDQIDCSGSNDIRQQRRIAVQRTQSYLDKLERVKTEDTMPRPTATAPSSAGFSFKASTSAPARTHENRLPSFGETSKSGGKMRSSKRETHYKSPIKEEDDFMEEADLPNANIQLQMNGKTLQPFFGAPTKPGNKPLMASTPFPGSSKDSSGFTFAPPTVKETTRSSKPKESTPPPAQSLFKFSAPAQAGTPSTGSTLAGSNTFPKAPSFGSNTTPFGFSTSSSASSPKSPAQMDEEETEEPSGGIKVAKNLKAGSCLEVFGMLSKSTKDSTDNPQGSSESTKPLSLADKFKPAAGEWTCDSCCVQNKPDVNNCACCMTAKPTANKPLFGQSSIAKSDSGPTTAAKSVELPLTKAPVVNSGFGDKFKAKPGEWECDVCMIRNNADVSKCVSCQTAKPGGAVAPAMNSSFAPLAAQAPGGFGDKFKPASGTWECDTCMLGNKSTVSRCVACETPKPGATQTLASPPESAYTFGSASNSGPTTVGGFKFGGGGANPSSGSGSITSGTSGGFKFGGSADDSTKSSSNSVSSGFKFGEPASSGGFKFGSGSSTNDKENAAPPPNADPFKSGALSAPETTKPPAAMFAATATDSAPSADKVTKSQFAFGGATSKTDSAPSVNFSTGNKGSTEPKSTLDFGGPKTSAADAQSAAANPVFKFGGNTAAAATTTKEQKDSSSKAAFQFGKADASSANDAKSIFGGNQTTQPSTQADTEQSASKPLFNFKNSNTNTNIQFGSAGSNATAAQDSKLGDFAAGNTESSATFNFGGASKTTTENKDTGSTNSVSKPGGFAFGANASSTPTSSSTAAPNVTPFKFGAAPEATAQPQNASPFVFGAAPASTNSQNAAPPTGGFSFSATAPATTQQSKPAFGAAETPAQNSSPFVFGAAPAATNSQNTAPPAGGFSFQANAPATTQQAKPAFGATNAATNSVFQGFGSNASSANPSPVFGNPAPTTTATSVPNFGTAASTPFGSQNQQQGAAPPAFGAANSGTPFGGTPAPAFGSGSTPAFGAGSAAPAFGSGTTAAAPAFGSNSATPQNAGFQPNNTAAFQFGANNAQPNPQQNSVFKFGGGSQNNNAAPANAQNAGAGSGFNFNAQQAPSFNFTASAPPAPGAGASPFQFNAAGNQASNPFSPMPSASSTHSGRKIKRAVRRNMRK